MKQLFYIIDGDDHMNAVWDDETESNVAFDTYAEALEKAKEMAQQNPTSTYVVAMGWATVAVPPAKPARVREFC